MKHSDIIASLYQDIDCVNVCSAYLCPVFYIQSNNPDNYLLLHTLCNANWNKIKCLRYSFYPLMETLLQV